MSSLSNSSPSFCHLRDTEHLCRCSGAPVKRTLYTQIHIHTKSFFPLSILFFRPQPFSNKSAIFHTSPTVCLDFNLVSLSTLYLLLYLFQACCCCISSFISSLIIFFCCLPLISLSNLISTRCSLRLSLPSSWFCFSNVYTSGHTHVCAQIHIHTHMHTSVCSRWYPQIIVYVKLKCDKQLTRCVLSCFTALQAALCSLFFD